MRILQAGKSLVRSLILPRPSALAAAGREGGPLVIAGMFRTGNGIGRAARSCFEALEAEGYAPRAADLSAAFNQVDLEETVPLVRFEKRAPGTLIVFANPPEIERALMSLGLRRWDRWRIIGAWSWEFAVAPASWARQAQFVSEIWAPSQFVADGFEAQYGRPVFNVPHFIPLAAPQAEPADTGRPLSILTVADGRSSLERKNILASVRIFQEALPAPFAAELVVKCRNLDVAPGYARALREAALSDPRIRLIEGTLSQTDQDRLLDGCDILLSPHRSEGFGVHLAEAMARGKCVIATGWSGNLQFMSPECAALLPYTLVPLDDPAGIYPALEGALWAEPDLEAGAEALADLAKDPGKRQRLGAAASAAIAEKLGTAPYRRALG